MMADMVEVEFSGIPEGATFTAMVTGSAQAIDPDDADGALIQDAIATTVTPVTDGSATVMLGGTPDEEGMVQAHATVELSLTLTADPGNADISFPLSPGSVMAKATFTDPADVDNFANAFTDLRDCVQYSSGPVRASLSGRDCSEWVQYGNLRHQTRRMRTKWRPAV